MTIKVRKVRSTLPTREVYESLSKYVQDLERRILALEDKNGIRPVTLHNKSGKLIKDKQHEIHIQHVIGAINNYFNCSTSDWLKVSRQRKLKEMKWILYNTLRLNYNMDNYHLISLMLDERFGFKVDRTTVYHSFNMFDDMIGLRDVYSERFMNKYNEIKKQL